uniref:Reverse transcriptase Ty1/copia-type domain-containing protein n=1 Tax=Amphimedon queenslandica TaxID=400682 RepID=A0A1X7U099_AMPQE
MDVKTAFLNGELKETVYIKQPEGYEEKGKEELVCRLKRSIYGLKQSPHCWNYMLDLQLKKMGFVQSNSDPCLYISITVMDHHGTITNVPDISHRGRLPQQVLTFEETNESLTNERRGAEC